MLEAGKTQVFANVPIELKARMDALKDIDKVLYSNSRVTTECISAHLAKVEQRVHSFRKPTRKPRRRLASV